MKKVSFKKLHTMVLQYQLNLFRDLYNDGGWETAAEYRAAVRKEKDRFKHFDSFEDLASVYNEQGYNRHEAFEQLLFLIAEEKRK